jgi:hypothetical protein
MFSTIFKKFKANLPEINKSSVTIKDRKIYIQQELTDQHFVTIPDKTIPKSYLIEVLEKQLSDYLDTLVTNWNEQKVAHISTQVGTSVYFVDGTAFHAADYEAIMNVISQLESLSDTLNAKDFYSFTEEQLNQIKKAFINFTGKWTSEASFIEELEMYKIKNPFLCTC